MQPAIKYREVNGTYYHKETPQEVINTLEYARLNKTRLVIDFGDAASGQSWNEKYDTRGTIGRSTGPIKVPLLIKTRRSTGGGAILDHCIVAIKQAGTDGVALYKHPNYHA